MSRVIAIDTETCLIEYPDRVNPDGVCLTWHDQLEDNPGILHLQLDAKECLTLLKRWLSEYIIVGHNIAFDLHVILLEFPELWSNVWKALRDGRIKDTFIREKLKLLSTTGNVTSKPCSLADLVYRYIGDDISDSKGGDAWRMRYEELILTPIAEWPADAVVYAADDATYTLEVYKQQEVARRNKGAGSMNSETLQVASAFALRGMEIQGIPVDTQWVEEIGEPYVDKFAEASEKLKEFGIIRSSGSKDMSKLLEYAENWGIETYTSSGRLSLDKKTLAKLTTDCPVYKAYMDYSNALKAVTTFIPQLSEERIHPRFNPLVNTLRTSCKSSNYYKYKGEKYGKKVIKRGDPVPSVNLQQIPSGNDFRGCFLPETGYMLVSTDYANLELCCAAQTYYSLFHQSKMREVLNSGQNLHDSTGHIIYQDYTNTTITFDSYKQLLKDNDKNAKFCRKAAKFVNLGCPGGQSADTIFKLANSMGVEISISQAEAWKMEAEGKYPEMQRFFKEYLPTRQRGQMFINVDEIIKTPLKTIEDETVYKTEVIKVRKQKPRYDIEVAGIYRARCIFTAASNGITMQILGALGKKRAMVKVYQECTDPSVKSILFGSKLHIDLHDELVLSVPVLYAEACQHRICEIMVEEMQKVLPDMRIEVESTIQRRWSKDPDPAYGVYEYHKDA